MKKYFYLIVSILLVCPKAAATPGVGTHPLHPPFSNYTVGYQLGYASMQKQLAHSIDICGTNVLVNYGYNYHSIMGHKAFVGVGMVTLLQVQVGHAFSEKDFLLRCRSDLPILFIERKLLPWKLRKLLPRKFDYDYYSTIGFFYEASFNNGFKGYNAGISLGISLWDIIFPYWRHSNAKKAYK